MEILTCAKNYLDDLVIKLSAYDGNSTDFSQDDVRIAFESSNFAIKWHTTPEALYKGLQAYLTVRFFKDGGSFSDANLPEYIAYALDRNVDLRNIGDVVSVMMFALPKLSLNSVIGRELFFADETLLVDTALKISEKLVPEEIEKQLKNFKNFRKGKKRLTLVSLLDIAQRKCERRIGFSRVILDVVKEEKKSLLKETLKKILKKRDEVMKSVELDYDQFYSFFDEDAGVKPFEYVPIAETLGARVARSLGDIGIVEEEMVGEMAEILNNPLYDPSTRAMIAYSFGAVKYEDDAASEKAAKELISFLKRADLEEWQKQLMPRPILESLIALGKIGYGMDIIIKFAYDEEHADARVAAVRALGILRQTGKLTKEEEWRVESALKDKLADKDKEVSRTAFVWLNKQCK